MLYFRSNFCFKEIVIKEFSAEYCPYASRQMQSTKGLSSDEIYSFAHNYARLIRERNFNIGVCGEEVLILVIKEAPTGLFWQSSTADQNTDYYYKPVCLLMLWEYLLKIVVGFCMQLKQINF